ncbi:MAG: phospholipase D family protein [Planctomycetota bacterium]|nr:phospholipase D family protein [Planctomycetota bacterium]
MKRILSMVTIVTLLLCATFLQAEGPPQTLTLEEAIERAAAPRVDVLFSPNGGCSDRIIKEIAQARERVLVQAYYFTSAPIAKAIMAAKRRGVQCEVVLDVSQETQQYSSATFFYNQGIPIVIDDRHAIAHNKIILIDSDTIIAGSFNFTRSAEDSNAENLLVFKNHTDLFAKYLANYELHRKHARPYVREPASQATPRAPPTTKPQKPEEKQVTVYVTKSGSKYHKGHCSYLRKSKIAMSLEDAARTYAPCSRCRPPSP